MYNEDSKYRYRLETYDPKVRKHICPGCGKRTFVRYIDVFGGEYVSTDVGRCDREEKCGYHKTPRDFFAENGGKLADHGVEEFYDDPYTDSQIEVIFEKAMRGQHLSVEEVRQYKHAFLKVSAEMDYDAGWTQQYHYGAIRDNNSIMYKKLGPDTGFDSIGEFNTARAMSHFLDELNSEHKLTRTILYCLNPCANEVIATMLGNFQDGSEPGKIQFGSGWWFNDQLDGMTRQMNALSVLGLLSRFVGMLTDSRSFLSYPRHEYFRRLLCNLLGNDVESGKLPDDREALGRMVEDISYNNARRYFKFY